MTDPDGGAGTDTFPVECRPVLAFRVQPTSSLLMQNIAPAVEAAVVDGLGNPIAGRTDAITLSLAGGPAGVRLYGTATANTVAGVATFDGVALSKAGVGYVLNATALRVSGVQSHAFTITP